MPAPTDDAIDAIVDAVSSGARISPGSTLDASSRAAPVVTLPSTTSVPRTASPVVRRAAPVLAAFAIGLSVAVWSLRTFESVDAPVALSPAPPERAAAPAPPSLDPLPSRALRPMTRFFAATERRPFEGALVDPGALDALVVQEKTRRASADAAPVRRTERNEPTPTLDASPIAVTTESSVLAPSTPIEMPRETVAPPLEREAERVDTAADVEATETQAVRTTVAHYAQALEQLDVDAAAVLWPTVDRRALSRAFSSLKSQDVAVGDCDVALENATATARCQGTTQYVVKVGTSAPRTGRFEWLFRMRKHDDAWKIEGVTASQIGSIRDWQ